MQQSAKVVSYLFHPFFVPFSALVFLMYWPSDSKGFIIQDVLYFLPEPNKKGLMVVIGTLTLAAPVVSILILYFSKIISSLQLENKEERKLPYGLTIFYVMLTYFILYRAPENSLSPFVYSAIFGTLMSLIVLYLSSPFIKISAHMTAWGGLAGFLTAYLMDVDVSYGTLILVGIIILSGIIGASRVILKAHTNREIYMGFSLAFVIHFLVAHFEWFVI